nr:hypothetical protein [Tanacetum cinerariifolium]
MGFDETPMLVTPAHLGLKPIQKHLLQQLIVADIGQQRGRVRVLTKHEARMDDRVQDNRACARVARANQAEKDDLIAGELSTGEESTSTTFEWAGLRLTPEQLKRLHALEARNVSLSELKRDELLSLYLDGKTEKVYAAVGGRVYQVQRRSEDGRWLITGEDGSPGPGLKLDGHQRWQLDLDAGLKGGGGLLTKMRAEGAETTAEDALIIEATGMPEIRKVYRERALNIGEAHLQAKRYLENCLDNLNVHTPEMPVDERVLEIVGDFFGVTPPGADLLIETERTIKALFDEVMDASLANSIQLKADLERLQNEGLSHTSHREDLFVHMKDGEWGDLNPEDSEAYNAVLALTKTRTLEEARHVFLSDAQKRSRVLLANADSVPARHRAGLPVTARNAAARERSAAAGSRWSLHISGLACDASDRQGLPAIGDALVFDDRLVELHALAGVTQCGFECRTRNAQRLSGNADATAFQVGEGDRQAFAALTQQVVGGDAAVAERHRASVGGADAHLVFQAVDPIPRVVPHRAVHAHQRTGGAICGGDFFDRQGVGHVIDVAAAPLLGDDHAQQAQLTKLGDERVVDPAGFLPGLRVGGDFIARKISRHVADHHLFFGQFKILHRSGLLTAEEACHVLGIQCLHAGRAPLRFLVFVYDQGTNAFDQGEKMINGRTQIGQWRAGQMLHPQFGQGALQVFEWGQAPPEVIQLQIEFIEACAVQVPVCQSAIQRVGRLYLHAADAQIDAQLARHAGEEVTAAHIREVTNRDFRHRQSAALGDHAQVGGLRQAHTTAQHQAVHQGDDGFAVMMKGQVEGIFFDEEVLMLGAAVFEAVVERTNVATCAESLLAGPTQDHGVDVVILRPCVQSGLQLANHGQINGVEALRAIKGEVANMIAYVEQNGVAGQWLARAFGRGYLCRHR